MYVYMETNGTNVYMETHGKKDREVEVRREGENGTGREGNLLVKYKDFGHNQPQVQVSVLTPNDCTNLETLFACFHY